MELTVVVGLIGLLTVLVNAKLRSYSITASRAEAKTLLSSLDSDLVSYATSFDTQIHSQVLPGDQALLYELGQWDGVNNCPADQTVSGTLPNLSYSVDLTACGKLRFNYEAQISIDAGSGAIIHSARAQSGYIAGSAYGTPSFPASDCSFPLCIDTFVITQDEPIRMTDSAFEGMP